MKMFLLVLCLLVVLHGRTLENCDIEKKRAWSELEMLVDSGYVFSSVEWHDESCQWELNQSPFYQIEKFLFPNLKSLPSNVLSKWEHVDSGNLQSTVKTRISYLESFGYFKVHEVIWKRDSMRQVLYPILFTRPLKASQANLLFLSQGEGLQSSLEVELKNIRLSLNDVGLKWVLWPDRRELSGYLQSHMVEGTFWSFMPSFRYDQRDSTLERLELVTQFQYRPIGKLSYGVQLKRVQGRSNKKWFKWDESALGLISGSEIRSVGQHRHLLNIGLGQGELGANASRYYFQEGENDFEVIHGNYGLSLRYFHGFYINIPNPISRGLGFYLEDPYKMRLAPQGYLYSQYYGGAIESWWFIHSKISLAALIEYDEWEDFQWENSWGPGLQLNIEQGTGLDISLSWIFPWQSTLQNSRINVGITNRF